MSSRHLCQMVLALLLITPAAALAGDVFAGTWAVTITPDDQASAAGHKEVKDKITFKGSKFFSETFKKKKFEEVDYEEDSRSGVIAKFTAKPQSKTEGKTEWTGTITANQIAGEIKWTKLDGSVLNFTFAGEKR